MEMSRNLKKATKIQERREEFRLERALPRSLNTNLLIEAKILNDL